MLTEERVRLTASESMPEGLRLLEGRCRAAHGAGLSTVSLTPTSSQLAGVLLLAPIVTILVCLLPVCLFLQGRPFLYASVRAGKEGRPFRLWKLRTMRVSDYTPRVLGGDAISQVTPLGRWLRATRLDELPQIINIVRGEMVFFGPRPPLPRYVLAYPETYLPLLGEPPGVTGLATVYYCNREAELLSLVTTHDEVEELYRRRCIPAKARLDAAFQRRQWVGLSVLVLVLTIWRTRRSRIVVRRIRHRVERAFGLRRAL